jgi:hypothetical protein
MPRAGTNYERVRFTYEGKAYETYGKTLEEALEKKIKKLYQLKTGEVGISSKMTVRRWANEYLKTYRKETNGTKSYKEMEARAEKYIFPAIGRYRLSEVTDVHLQKILKLCRNEPKSYRKAHTPCKRHVPPSKDQPHDSLRSIRRTKATKFNKRKAPQYYV